jgi:hypothetical protein
VHHGRAVWISLHAAIRPVRAPRLGRPARVSVMANIIPRRADRTARQARRRVIGLDHRAAQGGLVGGACALEQARSFSQALRVLLSHGIHVQARLEDAAQCLPVIIGATPEGSSSVLDCAGHDLQRSRRLDGHKQLPKIVLGVRFSDGIEVVRCLCRLTPSATKIRR